MIARVVRAGIGPIAWRTPGLTWVHDVGVGDEMVDGVDPHGTTPAAQSVSDSRPGTVIAHSPGAGRKGEGYLELGGLRGCDRAGSHRSVADRFERGWPELAQGVEATAGELARSELGF